MYLPFTVTVGTTGTLVWETVAEKDKVNYGAQKFPAGVPTAPRGIGVVIPASVTFYLVGEVGAPFTDGIELTPGPYTLPFDVVGDDALILAVGEGSQTIGYFVSGL
jgi:hypothetical protein